MAERPSVYTDFKDPFHLLNELRNIGLERVYKNAFAYGNREDMNLGYHSQPNPSIGRMVSPNYQVPVDTPMSTWTARQGSGRTLPPATQINYERDYGSQALNRGERQRIGTVAKPVAEVLGRFSSNISSIRARRKSEKLEDSKRAYRNTFDPSMNYGSAYMAAYEASQQAQRQTQQQTQQDMEMLPKLNRLEGLTNEMEDIGAQIEQRKNLINMTKGIEEFRNTQRQKSGQVEIERRKGIGQRISENVAPQVTETLPKSGLTPYKMLNPNPFDKEDLGSKLETIMSMKPSAPPQNTGLTPLNVDLTKSNIPPGQTSPFPPINKAQNTSVLGGSSAKNNPPPSGYNPSQGNPPGLKSMHRRRPR